MHSRPFSPFLLCFETFIVHVYLFKATKLPGGGCKQADALLSMMATNLAFWSVEIPPSCKAQLELEKLPEIALELGEPLPAYTGGHFNGQAEETEGAKWNLLYAR